MKPLEPLIERLKILPQDERGYPIPFFVAWIDGKPNFTTADQKKWYQAIREGRCWVCGQHLYAYKTFVIGPMCGINRTTTEPPCHKDCAEWSVRNCPFLANPNMKRNEAKAMGDNPGGIMITRNPGVSLVWTTKTFKPYKVENGHLIELGDPTTLEFYKEGRLATRDEINFSIESGLPLLLKVAEQEDAEKGNDKSIKELMKMKNEFYGMIRMVRPN